MITNQIVCHKCFCVTIDISPDSYSEVFANAKVKLLRGEVRATARVKLSLPTLPKAKLHYPQDIFTYLVNFTCPLGQTELMGTPENYGFGRAHLAQPFFVLLLGICCVGGGGFGELGVFFFSVLFG